MNLDEKCTDLGNARRLVRYHGDDLRYSHASGCWLVWDGRRWKKDDNGAVDRCAKDSVRKLYGEAANADDAGERQALADWALKCEARDRRVRMIEDAKSEPEIPVDEADFDADPYLLNCLNGTLDLRSATLRPHRREDLMTKLCPVDYDPDARSELWERVIEKALPESETQSFFQRAAGYTLLGRAGEDKVIVVHGLPRTAKGTLQNAIASTMGDYAMTAGLDDFAERKDSAGRAQPELVRLRGARLVSVYETSQRLRLSASLVKTLAGSDPITVRDLYAKPFTFVPSFTLWVATNHRPRVPEDDDAIWERLREIPFNQVVPEDERDPAVRAELSDPKASGAAILAWCVEGAHDYLDKGLTAPKSVRTATDEYREEMDPLHEFATAVLEFGDDYWVAAGALRDAYERWAQEDGTRPKGGKAVGQSLRKRGCKSQSRDKKRGWLHVRLRQLESEGAE